MSEQQEDIVQVVDPNGNVKTLPRAAAEQPEVIALGFKVINNVDYGVQRIKHDATEPVAAAEAEDASEEPAKNKGGRPKKAQA
jgi:hypothetical protein